MEQTERITRNDFKGVKDVVFFQPALRKDSRFQTDDIACAHQSLFFVAIF